MPKPITVAGLFGQVITIPDSGALHCAQSDASMQAAVCLLVLGQLHNGKNPFRNITGDKLLKKIFQTHHMLFSQSLSTGADLSANRRIRAALLAVLRLTGEQLVSLITGYYAYRDRPVGVPLPNLGMTCKAGDIDNPQDTLEFTKNISGLGGGFHSLELLLTPRPGADKQPVLFESMHEPGADQPLVLTQPGLLVNGGFFIPPAEPHNAFFAHTAVEQLKNFLAFELGTQLALWSEKAGGEAMAYGLPYWEFQDFYASPGEGGLRRDFAAGLSFVTTAMNAAAYLEQHLSSKQQLYWIFNDNNPLPCALPEYKALDEFLKA